MTKLQGYFETFVPLIEAELKTLIAACEDDPTDFSLMMQYHMGWVDEAGKEINSERGKRLRPMLCLLVAEALCGEAGKALPAAVALELIHNFSLLHDDIEDQSTTRRGRKTAWSIWGEGQAINAGDAMFAIAHHAIPRLGQDILDNETVITLMTTLTSTCLKLTKGQHLDMQFEGQELVTPDEYLEMIRGKTAAMVSASAAMGAISAGATEQQIESFALFGSYLGLAFQIQDDLLDIWGDPSVTGKEQAIDIKQKKKSYPVILGLKRSGALRERYAQSNSFSEEAIREIISLLEENNAKRDAELLAKDFTEKSLEYLGMIKMADDAGSAIHKLVLLLVNRDK